MSELKAFADTMKAMKDDMETKAKAEAKTAIKASLKTFFGEFPEVAKLKWTQYTPYFNDGEACVFGVNSVEAVLKTDKKAKPEASEEEEDEDEDDDSDGQDSWHFEYHADKKNDPSLDDETRKRYELISKALKEFDTAFGKMEDALLFAFGDHVEITCTPKDITVDEYSHD